MTLRTSAYLFVAVMIVATGAQAANGRVTQCGAGDIQCLIVAINSANANGDGRDRIVLAAGTYTLVDVDNTTDGPNGLPSITTRLTIDVAGDQAVLTRDSGAAPFRLFHVTETGHLTLRRLTVTQGLTTSGFKGGGLLNRGGKVRVENSTFAANDSSEGGGILNLGGEVTIADSTLSDNNGTSSGGGLSTHDGVVAVHRTTFARNVAGGGSGGAISSTNGHITVTDSTVDTNHAIGGGGIAIVNSTVRIARSIIANNDAFFDGGGVAVDGGSVRIRHTTFTDNGAQGAAALYVRDNATVVVANSAFVANQTSVGNIITNNEGSTVWMTNITFARNSLATIFPGNNVIENAGNLILTNGTFGENHVPAAARIGSLVRSDPGAVTILQNTILAHAADEPFITDCQGPITSSGHNVIGDPTGCSLTLQPTDWLGDPGLAAFTDDGTPGNGHFPLLGTSLAIDAGDVASCPRKDQIGNSRQGACDIGAIEFRD